MEEKVWNNNSYKLSGEKYSRQLLFLSEDVLNDRALLLFKKYNISEEDAGKLTAIFGILTAKGIGKHTNLTGGFRR